MIEIGHFDGSTISEKGFPQSLVGIGFITSGDEYATIDQIEFAFLLENGGDDDVVTKETFLWN